MNAYATPGGVWLLYDDLLWKVAPSPRKLNWLGIRERKFVQFRKRHRHPVAVSSHKETAEVEPLRGLWGSPVRSVISVWWSCSLTNFRRFNLATFKNAMLNTDTPCHSGIVWLVELICVETEVCELVDSDTLTSPPLVNGSHLIRSHHLSAYRFCWNAFINIIIRMIVFVERKYINSNAIKVDYCAITLNRELRLFLLFMLQYTSNFRRTHGCPQAAPSWNDSISLDTRAFL